LVHPFDRDCGTETAGFGEFRLRLVHLARQRVGGRQVRVDVIRLPTHVERLAIFADAASKWPRPISASPKSACQTPIAGSRGLKRIVRSRSAFACSSRPSEFSAT